jgi:long-chain fatty acid transport protein
MKKIALALRLLGTSGIVVLMAQAHASGYHFGVQSVSGQGVANAGGAAVMDAATVFYNPAGLTYLPGDNISAAMLVVSPHIKVSNLQATTAAGTPISGGGTGKSPTSAVAVPQLYMTHQFTEQLFAGLGVFVPFGDKTRYDDNWNGRYNGVNLEMKSFAVNPQLAYKFNDHFSVGLGFTAQYMDAKFRKRADFGTQLGATLRSSGVPASTYGPFFAGNGRYDGALEYEGHDWGYGWNIGALWQVDPTLRLGAAYRSSINHTLSGKVEWSIPNAMPITPAMVAGLTAKGYATSTGRVNVKTPDSFSLNFYKELHPQLALMGDWTHTRHSKFQELRLNFSNDLPDAVIKQKWKNTNRYSLATTYRLSDPWLLRFGVAYDQSPVPNSEVRIASLPDSDRTWYSIGANYAFTKNVSVDLAYTYLHIKDASMSNRECSTAQGCTGSGTLTKADFKSYANIFGVQLNYRF